MYSNIKTQPECDEIQQQIKQTYNKTHRVRTYQNVQVSHLGRFEHVSLFKFSYDIVYKIYKIVEDMKINLETKDGIVQYF